MSKIADTGFEEPPPLEFDKNHPLRPLQDLADKICEKFPKIEKEPFKREIIRAEAGYRFALFDSNYGDERERVESLFDVCCKARDLADSMRKLDINGMRYVTEKWDKEFRLKRYMWEKTCAWLNALAAQCSTLSHYKDQIPLKPGRKNRTKDAELELLRTLDAFLMTSVPNEKRGPLVQKIAVSIHGFTTNDREPQKFRKRRGAI